MLSLYQSIGFDIIRINDDAKSGSFGRLYLGVNALEWA